MIQLNIRSRTKKSKFDWLPVLLGIRLWLHPKNADSLQLQLWLCNPDYNIMTFDVLLANSRYASTNRWKVNKNLIKFTCGLS